MAKKANKLTETPKLEIHIKEDPRPTVIHTMAQEPAQVKEPSDQDKIVEEARYQKRRATQDWISGRVTTKDHDAVHRRANHVLAHRDPSKFKGKSGERKPKNRDIY